MPPSSLPPDAAGIGTLRNLGPRGAAWLAEAGFTTAGALREAGAVAAFQAVRFRQPRVSLNLLWALAAGLEGRDWRQLEAAEKAVLQAALPPWPPRPGGPRALSSGA